MMGRIISVAADAGFAGSFSPGAATTTTLLVFSPGSRQVFSLPGKGRTFGFGLFLL